MKKKQILTLIAVGVASIAVAMTSVKGEVKKNPECIKVEKPAPARDGYCQCGGKKVYTSKAYWKKRKCGVCDGKGYTQHPYINNGRKERCTLCEGRGWIPQYYPGYKCNRCGLVYDTW